MRRDVRAGELTSERDERVRVGIVVDRWRRGQKVTAVVRFWLWLALVVVRHRRARLAVVEEAKGKLGMRCGREWASGDLRARTGVFGRWTRLVRIGREGDEAVEIES